MGEATESRNAPLGGVTFADLVMLFGSAALLHLGATPDPERGQSTVDLDQARHAIDMLELVKEKTAGNLSTAETEILDGVLFDLRFRYVEAAKGKN